MPDVMSHQDVVQTRGPATGRITGINHLVLFVRDLDEAVRFYRDVLGLKVVRTQPRFATNASSVQSTALMTSGELNSPALVDYSVRQVFFEMGNGELFSIYEVEDAQPMPDASIVSFLWPPQNNRAPETPGKLDHLAFNVETRADLGWFRDHLTREGVACSDIIERKGQDGGHRFLTSIYFFDPSGNPLEMATLDSRDPGWEGYDFRTWFRDTDPVPALVDREEENPHER